MIEGLSLPLVVAIGCSTGMMKIARPLAFFILLHEAWLGLVISMLVLNYLRQVYGSK